MNFLFICSSLEPGKDGVGDYTRKLAAALIKQGHTAFVVALNDKFIKESFTEGVQVDENVTVPVLRFSTANKWKERIDKTSSLVENFVPDLISLQYVPYGFNKKGLPFYLPGIMQQIKGNSRWHIMFHEMWIGISVLSPFKDKAYGFFQKRICEALIKTLQPEKITTTNRLYQLVLKEKKIQAALLPLFSNISICSTDSTFLHSIEEHNNISLHNKSVLTIGIFGTLYPYASLNVEIPKYLENRDAVKNTVLILLGRNNHPEELGKLKKALNGSVQLIELGELEAEKVSTIFNILDEAILCTPKEHIGKSGAFAALNYHGVKVTILSSQPIPQYEQEIKKYNQLLEKKTSEEWGVEYVAGKFINLFENNNPLEES